MSIALVSKESFDPTNKFYAKTKMVAKKELREIDREIPEKLREMERIIKTELPNLECKIDNAFLMKFLRCAKCDVDKAFKWIKGYYDFKKSYSFMFANLLPSKLMDLYKENFFFYLLPHRDSKGRLVGICKPGEYDPRKISIEDVLRIISLLANYCMNSEITQINGVSLVFDWTNFTFWHLRHIPPKYIFMLAKAVQGAYPIRLKGFHHVHEPAAFKMFYVIIKPFLKDKIIKRIYIYGHNVKKLHEHFEPHILPTFLEGEIVEDDIKDGLIEDIHKFEDFFKDSLTHGFK